MPGSPSAARPWRQSSAVFWSCQTCLLTPISQTMITVAEAARRSFPMTQHLSVRHGEACRDKTASKPAAAAPVLDRIHQHGEHDDGAGEYRLPVGRYADDHQAVRQQPDDEGTEHGAAHRA